MQENKKFYRSLLLISPLIIIAIALIYASLVYFFKHNHENNNNSEKVDFVERIKHRGKIIALTSNNSTEYFLYRGRPLGFQFELLHHFADYIGVGIEIKVCKSLEESYYMLMNEDVDLLAMDLTITRSRARFVDFTQPINRTRPVLVQKLPQDWRFLRQEAIDEKVIRNLSDLNNKVVYIQENTSFGEKLFDLSMARNLNIDIHHSENFEVEQLIRMVEKGDIEYTVADEHVAMVNKTYNGNVDIKTPIGGYTNLAWAVKPGQDSLLALLNQWLDDFLPSKEYTSIYRKYFVNSKLRNFSSQEIYSIKGKKISNYDDLIRKYSKIIGWDWQLVASLIYQESKFNPDTQSWAGALGIMQMMPETAERFGLIDLTSPEEQIKAGTKYLKWLEDRFSDTGISHEDRIKFVLASYNVGPGHIFDARKLAKKYNKDPKLWLNNVDSMLTLKSESKYFLDKVVEHGYVRGDYVVDFANQIWNRYLHYKNLIK